MSSETRTLKVAAGLGAVLALAAVPACHRKAPPQETPLQPAASASARPVDRLAPGELVEGTEKAFGLLLPLGMHVQTAFMQSVYVRGEPNMDKVANYIRARVRGGTVTRGATGTVFDGVTVPTEPQRILHILVTRPPTGDSCRLEVRDVTPAPPQPVPTTEAERFRAAGLTPDGKFLDPQHRQ